MSDLEPLVLLSRDGDLAAFGRLVGRTQAMAYGVCRRVLRSDADAADATQETFLRAFRRLNDLKDPAAFPGWLRRVAVSVARNHARRRRSALLQPSDAVDVPVLDEAETSWSEAQRHALARALLTLTDDERRLCDRYYHGRWTAARLAADAGVAEAAIRKRLQRVRDHLREEIQMQEHPRHALPAGLPDKVVELLARPNLAALPENPVGRMADLLLARYPGCRTIDVPETVDVAAARELLGEYPPAYLADDGVHAAGDGVMLRADLDVPMLLASRGVGVPARLAAVGPVYRNARPGPLHEQAFHQLEVMVLDEQAALDVWAFMGQTLRVVHDLLPGRAVLIEAFDFPACSAAWEVSVLVDDKPVGVLAWGVYTDAVVRHLGGDPARHAAFGIGYGLERMAAVHFGYDDIRKLPMARL